MLICPKHIYNFCLIHACFVCLCHVLLEISYTFEPIWTNLLTQCTQLQFLFSAIFVFQVFRPLKVLQKIRKNQIKISATEASGVTKRSEGGPPPASQEGRWRGPTLGRARDPPELLVVAPLTSIDYSGSFRGADFFSVFPDFLEHF